MRPTVHQGNVRCQQPIFGTGIGNWATDVGDWSEGYCGLGSDRRRRDSTGTANLTFGGDWIAGLQIDAPSGLEHHDGRHPDRYRHSRGRRGFPVKNGGSASVTGALFLTGNGVVWLDLPFNGGSGGSNLKVGGRSSAAPTTTRCSSATPTSAPRTRWRRPSGTGNPDQAAPSSRRWTSPPGAAGSGTLGVETGFGWSLPPMRLLSLPAARSGRSMVGSASPAPTRGSSTPARWNQQRADRSQHSCRRIGAVFRSVVSINGALAVTGNGVVWLDLQRRQRRQQPEGRRDADRQQYQQQRAVHWQHQHRRCSDIG